MEPVRFALVGLGGYGRWIMELLCDSADLPNPPVSLVAAADPNPQGVGPHVQRLEKRRTRLFTSYEQVLALPEVEAVWLPVPIALHRPFVEMAMKAGKVAVVEKPVTGTVDDLAAMIAARDAAGGRVAVGFQDIYADASISIKRQLLDGAVGTIRSATVDGCWPRGLKYYGRNTWAGKMRQDGTWVLDSPANNALAHFVNLALFLLGRSMGEMAKLESVSAELYRVNDIENYDTCSLRVVTEGNVPLLVHFTHACREEIHPQIVIHGDRGTMRFQMREPTTFSAGGKQWTVAESPDLRREMADKLARWVRGDRDVIVATLEMSGTHLTVINGASEAAAVKTIDAFETHKVREDTFRILPGIEATIARASREQKMLYELGDVPWSVPARSIDLRGYKHFAGPAK